MFFRVKGAGGRQYLQIAESYREGARVRQRVIATLGRLDVLQASGQLDRLLRSGLRFSEKIRVLDAHAAGETEPVSVRKIGADLVFGRLWESMGVGEIVRGLAGKRRHEFDLERAVYLTVLHRLFASGRDRAAEVWKESYRIPGAEELSLHQLYRAMGWLGEEIGPGVLGGARCTKDLIEESLFDRGRDLFSEVGLVFFDTTSIYFEGAGGESLGRHGHSKDHRPDLHQMIVGIALDVEGRPICCEMWPGNTADAKSLVPVVERMRAKFRVRELCVVADRGFVSEATLEALGKMDPPVHYVIGVRMRRTKEVGEVVLKSRKEWKTVTPERVYAKDPAPLKVKEVEVEDGEEVFRLLETEAAANGAEPQFPQRRKFFCGIPYFSPSSLTPRAQAFETISKESSISLAFSRGIWDIKGGITSPPPNERITADNADKPDEGNPGCLSIRRIRNISGKTLSAFLVLFLWL
jgi:hypothetical protein